MMRRPSKTFVLALIILQVCLGGILFYSTRSQVFTITTSAEEPFDIKHLLSHYASSPKDLQSLDKQYNITRVEGYRDKLKNVEYLDNFYYYNQKAVEERIKDRMENIGRVCESMEKSVSVDDNLYQINELGVTWCPVFKSGSTTWKNYFIDKIVLKKLSNIYNSLDILKNRRLTHRTTMVDGKQYYKDECVNNIRFTVVRHPLLRLVSHVKNAAKDNEMVAMKTSWIYKAVVENRIHAIENSTLKKLYLKEFDDYFTWLKFKRKLGSYHISDNNPFLNPPHPRLDDLVNFIKRNSKYNGHWAPAWNWCNVCANKFNYIVKLEEPLELWFLLDKLGLWAERKVFLNKTNSSQKTENQTENITYIESLNIMLENDERKWVNKYFRYDFELFGYDQLELLM